MRVETLSCADLCRYMCIYSMIECVYRSQSAAMTVYTESEALFFLYGRMHRLRRLPDRY
jgi:hypothetical protein